MRKWNGIMTVIVLLLIQIVIWNYFNLSQFVLLTFLPVIVLCMPVRIGTIASLLFAFFSGFAVDFFASGVLGLTSAALLPVALCRKSIITLVFGEEIFSRGENISLRRQGLFKVNLGTVMASALFLIIYIWADGAGLRPFWFNSVRFLASLVASSIISIPVASLLTDEEVTRWR